MVEKLFQSFNDIVGGSIKGLDRPDLAAKATVIALGVNVILSPLFAIRFGLIGVAVGTAIAWFVGTVFRARYLSRFVSIGIPYRLLGWYTVSSLLMGGSLVVLQALFPVTSILLLVAEVGFGAVVYLGLSTVVPEVRNEIVMPGVEMLRSQAR
jgi:O-antigen/teichoic acid export membrane protein